MTDPEQTSGQPTSACLVQAAPEPGTPNRQASYRIAERLDWTMSGNLVEFAAARGFLFIALVLYSLE
jgi:hypothetical protein